MKIEEIRELAQIMKENGLGILELQEDGTNLRMEAASAAAPQPRRSCLWYKRCPPLHPCRQLRSPCSGGFGSAGSHAGWHAGGL